MFVYIPDFEFPICVIIFVSVSFLYFIVPLLCVTCISFCFCVGSLHCNPLFYVCSAVCRRPSTFRCRSHVRSIFPVETLLKKLIKNIFSLCSISRTISHFFRLFSAFLKNLHKFRTGPLCPILDGSDLSRGLQCYRVITVPPMHERFHLTEKTYPPLSEL